MISSNTGWLIATAYEANRYGIGALLRQCRRDGLRKCLITRHGAPVAELATVISVEALNVWQQMQSKLPVATVTESDHD